MHFLVGRSHEVLGKELVTSLYKEEVIKKKIKERRKTKTKTKKNKNSKKEILIFG
jgi:hypothetical protein